MQISPADPTTPWRRDNAGFPCVLQGSEVSNLTSSSLWRRNATEGSAVRTGVEYVAKRTKKSNCVRGLPESVLSVEVYMGLLCRFHSKRTMVLATWDPCAVVQAAAVQLAFDSIVYLGMSSKSRLGGLDVTQTPLLGVTSPGLGEVIRVVADNTGNADVSPGGNNRGAGGAAAQDEGKVSQGGLVGGTNVNHAKRKRGGGL